MLPKSDRLASQLCGLERRVSRAGKDGIDHGPGGHDDLANAAAGCADLVVSRRQPMKIHPDVLAQARVPARPIFVRDGSGYTARAPMGVRVRT